MSEEKRDLTVPELTTEEIGDTNGSALVDQEEYFDGKGTVYNTKQTTVLNYSIGLRVKTLKKIEATQDLADHRTARVVNEMATGLESSILKLGDQQLKHKENDTADRFADMAQSLFSMPIEERNKLILDGEDRDIIIDADVVPTTTVDSEMHVGKQDLSLDEIITAEKDTDKGEE